jgi:hypothetical protein
MSLRTWISDNMGLNHSSSWTKKSSWSADPATIGQRFYDASLMLYPATCYACERGGVAWVDELCEIWVEAEGWLYTIGEIKTLGPHDLDDAGPDTARILPAVVDGVHVDNVLFNSQGLLPACRLLRHVAGIPASQRTSAMTAFVAAWAEPLIRDHAHRKSVVAHTITWGGEPWNPIRLTRWQQLVPKPSPPSTPNYFDAMVDSDWMLLQNIVEVRHALAVDPTIYSATSQQLADLDEGVDAGIALVVDRIVHTAYGDLYFGNEMATHPDWAYSGVGGHVNPFGSPAAESSCGWDTSHYHRIPQMLRAIYDARIVLGLDWPTDLDLKAAADYYATVPFNGNYEWPQFANYANGIDGWYRVDATSGYPPSGYQNANGNDNTRSLFVGSVWGWGRLAPFSSKLAAVLEAFMDLANATWEGHASRVAYYNAQPFRAHVYPVALFALAAAWPERASA